MLTSNLVRVRLSKNRIIPRYLDPADAGWSQSAESLLALLRAMVGRTRGELEDEIEEQFGGLPNPQIYQGLAKLLEDRCDFETISGHPPDELREAVFAEAAQARRSNQPFNRTAILSAVATTLNLTPETIDQGLFADLKSEQHIARFDDTTPQRLLERYNVALAQGVLFKAVRVEAIVRGETPARFRQLLRKVKFHRLICDVKKVEPASRRVDPGGSYRLVLDGPLSLFSATQKYGLQLASFLPSLLLCRSFEMTADLRWGPQRLPRTFTLSSDDGLVSHLTDTGTYVPPELAMFVELFRKKIAGWEIQEEAELVPLGDGYWAPDFCLIHSASGKRLYLEVLGFWRRSSLDKHLERLRAQVKTPFLLAVSDQLHVEEEELVGLPAGVIRFRQMPLPEDVVARAEEMLS